MKMRREMDEVPPSLAHRSAAMWTRTLLLGSLAVFFLFAPAQADEAVLQPPPQMAEQTPAHQPRRAQFFNNKVPDTVRGMANWVVDSSDNHGLPFIILDKIDAKVFVFDKDGKILGAAWVLVGLAHGDDSLPGIGTMPLTAITPEMRTTPAGRFVAGLGRDLGNDVLWVDYQNAISLHRVINTNPAERRLERIVSERPTEHRISYGCINVPAKFFDDVVTPTFKASRGITYILPEVKALKSVFPAYYDVEGGTVLPVATEVSTVSDPR